MVRQGNTHFADEKKENFINLHFIRILVGGFDLQLKKTEEKMAEKVMKVGVKKTDGYLYFVDKAGDVSRAKMARGRKGKGGKTEKVAKAGVKKQKGYLYFVDKAGDVSRAKMARGG